MKKLLIITTFFLMTAANSEDKKKITMPSINMPKIDMKDCTSTYAKLKPRCIKFLNKKDGIVQGTRSKIWENFEKNKAKDIK